MKKRKILKGLISISLCPQRPIPVLPKETRFTLPRVFLSISSCTLFSVFFSSLSPLSSILYPQLPAVRTIFGYFFIPKSQISSTFICYLCGLIRASAGKCDALAPCRPTCLSLHDGLRLLAFPLDRRSTIGPIGILCTVSSHQDTARSLSQTRPEALFSTVALSPLQLCLRVIWSL